MNTAIKRKVTVNHRGASVISNLRVPFHRGETVWVMVSPDTVVVSTSEPVSDRERAKAHFASTREVYDAGGGYQLTRPKAVTVEKHEEVSDEDQR